MSVSARRTTTPITWYVVVQNVKSHAAEVVARYPVTNLRIDVELMLTDRGVVRVKSGGTQNQINLKTKVPVKTELHCHSGEFEIRVLR